MTAFVLTMQSMIDRNIDAGAQPSRWQFQREYSLVVYLQAISRGEADAIATAMQWGGFSRHKEWCDYPIAVHKPDRLYEESLLTPEEFEMSHATREFKTISPRLLVTVDGRVLPHSSEVEAMIRKNRAYFSQDSSVNDILAGHIRDLQKEILQRFHASGEGVGILERPG